MLQFSIYRDVAATPRHFTFLNVVVSNIGQTQTEKKKTNLRLNLPFEQRVKFAPKFKITNCIPTSRFQTFTLMIDLVLRKCRHFCDVNGNFLALDFLT